ncbi:hypothetical protein [Streptomyces milbemycinicus]|uniref:hypothetical protein n=1 Tax=Streptomyces milbemycinicus TaxID=476552 RepID=UPI0033D817F6
MDVFTLVDNAEERRKFADAIASRGLRMGAVNCSAWPMHPQVGARHVEIMEAAVRLAEQLGVKKIVTMTGNPGESADARLTNWIFYPWPPENAELLARQWDETIAFWQTSNTAPSKWPWPGCWTTAPSPRLPSGPGPSAPSATDTAPRPTPPGSSSRCCTDPACRAAALRTTRRPRGVPVQGLTMVLPTLRRARAPVNRR